ncbi:MAG: SDR family NAD(P)-dependent oxidoreductase [Janthinobacterium lividum]
MSLFDLSGKVALVTGATRGIGRAIALRMAEAGARVVVSSRKQEACDEVAAAIEAAHGPDRALPVAASISDKAALARLVETVLGRWGRIDVLVCNAASNPYYGTMAGIADDQFRRILDNNILSSHWLVQMTAPGMAERRDGAVILISSVGGLRGSSTIGAYNVSKAADMQLARNLAVELGPDNIRVNCIAPGLIRTDFARALWEDSDTLRSYTDGTALRRIGEPDEIAGTAIFLASPAGSFATGQTFVIDGGYMVMGA